MKRYLTYLVAGVLMLATLALPVTAQTTTTEAVRIKVAKLGVGEKARATVFLKDGTKKKGYIAQAGEADFVLRDRKTDAPSTINYADVAKVDSNRGHSTARNVTIGVAVGVGAVLAVLGLLIASLD